MTGRRQTADGPVKRSDKIIFDPAMEPTAKITFATLGSLSLTRGEPISEDELEGYALSVRGDLAHLLERGLVERTAPAKWKLSSKGEQLIITEESE